MPAVIGRDAHKQFSVFVTIDGKGKTWPAVRVDHHRQEYVDFSAPFRLGGEIALQATGHRYWMVDEMEKAGNHRHLANPTEAKSIRVDNGTQFASKAMDLWAYTAQGTL